MEKLIPLLNELHDILHKTNLQNELKLPQIVVLGSQSTGKSSLLESIIGKEILPRGKGIVTRRPCEIQLKYTPDEESEWVEFGDHGGERIFDLDQVKRLIDDDTDKVCGKNKAISSTPIRLKFHSKNVVDLLIVDLPGIAKNPVGDQPKDIEIKILQIIRPYIENENSIILAVSKGSDDLANSEALKLAREVDPKGVRTIGVLTQLDLMEQGTDVLNDLQNKTYPLQLGYVGVVMRGSRDQERKSIPEQLKDEALFFQQSKAYRSYAEQMGILYLRKKMQVSLVSHIKKSFPEIRDTIICMLQSKEIEMRQYGEYEKLDDENAKREFILTMLQRFADGYRDLFYGKYLRAQHDELIGGSRISYIYWEIFRKTVVSIDPFDEITDIDIRTAIRNSNGLRPTFLFSEAAFENLLKKQIARLLQPSLQCAHMVYLELVRLINYVKISELERYDRLNQRISEVMQTVLQNCHAPTDQMIRNLIEIEHGFINTKHPDFEIGLQEHFRVEHEQQKRRDEQQAQQQYQQHQQQQHNLLQQLPSQQQQQLLQQQQQQQQQIQQQMIPQTPQSQQLAQQQAQLYQGPQLNARTEEVRTGVNGKREAKKGEQDGFNLLNYLGFGSGKDKTTELLDSKLSDLQKKNQQQEEGQQNGFAQMQMYSQNQAYAHPQTNAKAVNPYSRYNSYTYSQISENSTLDTMGQLMPQVHMPNIPSKLQLSEKMTDREQSEIRLLKNYITQYFNVVKKNIGDSIPKSITTFLVNKSIEKCRGELVSNLYVANQLEELLVENEYVSKKRRETKQTLQVLKNCLNVLNDVESKY